MWNGFGFSLPLCTIQFFVSRHVGSPVRLMIFLLQIALSISSSARNPVLFMSCWLACLHLVFGRPIFLFLVISVLNTFFACALHLSSSHARTSSIASLRSFCDTLVVPLMRLFLVLSLHVTTNQLLNAFSGLAQIIDYKGTKRRKRERREITVVKQEETPPGDVSVWHDRLHIPPLPPTGISRSKLIDINYELQV